MRLLLDSHIASALAEQLRGHGIDAVALPGWKGGNYQNADDRDLLAAAHASARVLVTFDCRTIPPLLKETVEAGQHHAGVILVSSQAFRANDVGSLLAALLASHERIGNE